MGIFKLEKVGDRVSPKKKRNIFIILIFILIISLGFILLDFLPLIHPKLQQPVLISYSFKAMIVLLTTILVFMIGKDCISKRDANMMKLIFSLIILADASLVVVPHPLIGISLFFFVQLGLTLRNSLGMSKKIGFKRNNKIRGSLFINTVLVTVLFILILMRIINRHMDDKLLLIIMVLYGLMISISLWTALANYLLGLFPRVNSIMVSLGMVFFVLCDINVGLYLVLPSGLIKIIFSNLIWVFYTPALTLLALSGYNYKNHRN